jgi:uncharacterized damage-inducible protein DinB
MPPTAPIFSRNTQWLLHAVEGLSDADSLVRPNERTNHIRFLFVHLIDARYYLAGLLGLDLAHPLEYLKDVTTIDEVPTFPEMDELKAMWIAQSREIQTALERGGETLLQSVSSARFPMTGNTLGDKIAFIVQHEMFHIGQMALIRKLLGYPAMRWE